MGEAYKIPLNWERVLFKSIPDNWYNDKSKGISESVPRVLRKT